MARGQAYGIDREYQEYCRDFLFRTKAGLAVYSGDGCDVSFPIGGTTWTVDVALKYTSGELVVAECRRRKDPSKQSEIAAFAYQVELLRKTMGTQVSGLFFAKCAPQLGLVKVGNYEGIAIAILPEGEAPASGFSPVRRTTRAPSSRLSDDRRDRTLWPHGRKCELLQKRTLKSDVEVMGDVDGFEGFNVPVPIQNLVYDETQGCFYGLVSLRAERDGAEEGRVYSIVCDVVDDEGNAATGIPQEKWTVS